MILNLTQHPASSEQLEAGVKNLQGQWLTSLQKKLTFDELPSASELNLRALLIARMALSELSQEPIKSAMIGGAPFFMPVLQDALLQHGITPLYAFSQRVSAETVQPDGSVRKTQVFRHLGFVQACEFAPENY